MIYSTFPQQKRKLFKKNFVIFNGQMTQKCLPSGKRGDGYPIIDAAMRQLNQTGWMHNRLRMITASF